ncbi:MAG: helix-turn-helix domain-containing protein [Chloroflexota bacterium]|nr:helix-turn-helix domain-containing protein [Chloroflexota bacterium]
MNIRDYLTIKEAAAFLGVSPNTLRNWERAGKIATHRHPLNGYRLYKQADLEALLIMIAQSAEVPKPSKERIDAAEPSLFQ